MLLAEAILRTLHLSKFNTLTHTHSHTVLPRHLAPHSGVATVSTISLSDSTENTTKEGLSLYVSTPMGRRLRPNTVARIQHHSLNQRAITVRTNSLGYRGPEINDKTEGHTRILFLGDSLTLADYLEEHETYVHQIQEKARVQSINLETINTGVGSIDTMTELAILKESGLSTKPDIVALSFYLNDFQPSRALQLTNVPTSLEWSHLMTLTFKAFTLLNSRWIENSLYAYKKHTAQRWTEEVKNTYSDTNIPFYVNVKNSATDWGLAWSNGAWEHMHHLIKEFKELSTEYGFKPIIIIFPVLPQIEENIGYNEPQEHMVKLTQELNIPSLDLLPYFRALRRDKNWNGGLQFYDHCHHSAAVNNRIADWILEFIKPHLSPSPK